MGIVRDFVLPDTLLFCLVCGMAASVDTENFGAKFTRQWGVVVGLCCQFFILPFVGFCVVEMFRPNDVVGTALLLVVSSPGGSYSNWYCSVFNADLALSVAMTTVSTIAAAGLLPLNTLVYIGGLYGNSVHIDWVSFLVPVAVVICAIAAGLTVGFWHPKYRSVFQLAGNVSGILLIIYSMMLSNGSWYNQSGIFYVTVACPVAVIVALIVSGAMASIPHFHITKPERTAICIECCYQNVGIAQAIAISMFDGDDEELAVSVALFYGFTEAVVCCLYLLASWKLGWTYANPREGLIPMLLHRHQGDDDAPDPVRDFVERLSDSIVQAQGPQSDPGGYTVVEDYYTLVDEKRPRSSQASSPVQSPLTITS